MAQRQFPYQTLTSGGTPQPVFATTTSAAVGPVGTPESSLQSIAVVDSSLFVQGDWIILDPAGSNPERLIVEAIVNSTHIKVQGIQFTHGSGVYVQLAVQAAIVEFQCKEANAGIIYIGTKGMSKTGAFLTILDKTAGGTQPNKYTLNIGSGENVIAADDFWFDGTTSDGILPSLTLK